MFHVFTVAMSIRDSPFSPGFSNMSAFVSAHRTVALFGLVAPGRGMISMMMMIIIIITLILILIIFADIVAFTITSLIFRPPTTMTFVFIFTILIWISYYNLYY